MNINEFLKKITARLSPKKKVTCAPPLASPARDWEILLLCACIAIIAAALFASATYFSVKRGPEIVNGVEELSLKNSVLNESALAHILSLYDARMRAHAEILKGM